MNKSIFAGLVILAVAGCRSTAIGTATPASSTAISTAAPASSTAAIPASSNAMSALVTPNR